MRLLLDEHYPTWLAERLTADGVDTVALIGHRPILQAASDTDVLRSAAEEGRVVVTEDARTFGIAIEAVPDHVGVIFCHHRRFPRTCQGLQQLRLALLALQQDCPPGLGSSPVVIWLPERT